MRSVAFPHRGAAFAAPLEVLVLSHGLELSTDPAVNRESVGCECFGICAGSGLDNFSSLPLIRSGCAATRDSAHSKTLPTAEMRKALKSAGGLEAVATTPGALAPSNPQA